MNTVTLLNEVQMYTASGVDVARALHKHSASPTSAQDLNVPLASLGEAWCSATIQMRLATGT
jgi:hypothetical protein